MHAAGLQNLERSPLEQVPPEPSELLDRNRYQRSSRDLVRHGMLCSSSAEVLRPAPPGG
jgi:hypothetical protein